MEIRLYKTRYVASSPVGWLDPFWKSNKLSLNRASRAEFWFSKVVTLRKEIPRESKKLPWGFQQEEFKNFLHKKKVLSLKVNATMKDTQVASFLLPIVDDARWRKYPDALVSPRGIFAILRPIKAFTYDALKYRDW